MTIRATWRLSQVARPGQLALLGRIGQSVDNLALLWEGNDPATMRWILGVSFVAMAVWMLIPDKLEGEQHVKPPRFGVFATTLFAFFLLEMGDKTQIATVALAAKYPQLAVVVAGTTLGMMVANVPAVLLGEVAATKLPLRIVRAVCAAVFAVIGVLVLLDGAFHFT